MRSLMKLFVFASLLLVPLVADAAPKVLICHGDATYANNLKTALTNTGAFAIVDLHNCSTSVPTLTQLKMYDAVLVFSSPSFTNVTTTGDNLADYFDQGGGVVLMAYAMYNGSGYYLQGKWSANNYNCLNIATTAGASASIKLPANDPNSPLVAGITGGISSSSRTLAGLNTQRGAKAVAAFTDNQVAICEMLVNGKKRVDLNWYPGSFTELKAGDHALLVKNALTHVAGGTFTPSPTAVTFPDTGTGATSQGVTVTLTNGSMMAQTVSSFAIAGTNPGDFAFSAPATPLTVTAGGSFTVTLTFTPQAIGNRSATFQVNVSGSSNPTQVALTGVGLGAKLSASPSPLKLGTSGVGVPVMTDLNIANSGGGKLTVTSVLVSQNTQEFFIVASPNYPIALPPGAQFAVTVRFNPTMTGMRTGEITINSDDPNSPTVKVPLIGTSGPPAITLDAGSVAFPVVNQGATSAYQPITITNTGFSPLNVTNITLGGTHPNDFKLDKGTFPGTLAPGGSSQFKVAFSPTAQGNRSATVIVTSNDPNTPTKIVNLFGTATAAAISVTPSMMDFGTVKVGAKSTAQNLTVTNMGNGALNVMAISFSGAGASSYIIGGGSSPPFNVAAGASSTTAIQCSPKANGALPATLTVMSDVGQKTVSLTCTGSAPMIALAPTMVDFGSVQLNASSMPQSVKITNNGQIDLTVSQISLSGTDVGSFMITQKPTTPLMLAPGQSSTVTMVYTAAKQAPENADLVIQSDDPQLPTATVKLKGQGVMLGLTVMPAMGLDFGMVQVGMKGGPKDVTLSNTGNAPLTVTNLVLSGTGSSRYSLDKQVPFTIAAGQSDTVPVTYTPQMVGMDLATLTVAAMGLQTVPVQLRGTGVAPSLAVTPMMIEFGPIPIGKTSMARSVTVKNGSTSPVTIGDIKAVSPAFKIDQTMTTKMLPGGMSTSFTVTFEPSDIGPVQSDINITLMGVSVPVAKVVATGSGVNPPPPTSTCAVSGYSSRTSTAGLALLASAVFGFALTLRRRRRR